MNRWTRAVLAAGAAIALAGAHAQGIVREAPADVRPAMLGVSATPPDVTLNGQPARLSPGSRIRDTNNMLVLSGSLAGRTVPAVYRRDGAGLVHEVWLLTPEEYQKVGGVNTAEPDGYKRFAELLALIFQLRSLAGLR